jgi:glycosyltransferase involved in cell wall biosynthesis
LRSWADAIASEGYEIIGLSLDELIDCRRLLDRDIKILHLHWPESILSRFLGLAFYDRKKLLLDYLLIKWRLHVWLRKVERLGIPVVVQIHELVSHQYHGNTLLKRLDSYFRRKIYNLSRAALTQEYSSLPCIEAFYGKKPFGVTFLGDYKEFHGPPVARSAARAFLKIPLEPKLFVYLGTARPNRNPKRIIELFNRLDQENAILVVAGMHDESYRSLGTSAKIRFLTGMLDNDAIRNILSAADFLVNDADEYLTSAVLRCSMSYGVPAIAYRYGASIDMVAGAVIDIDRTPGGLDRSIATALQMEEAAWAWLHEQALQRDRERAWQQCGPECHRIYTAILSLEWTGREASGG